MLLIKNIPISSTIKITYGRLNGSVIFQRKIIMDANGNLFKKICSIGSGVWGELKIMWQIYTITDTAITNAFALKAWLKNSTLTAVEATPPARPNNQTINHKIFFGQQIGQRVKVSKRLWTRNSVISRLKSFNGLQTFNA